MIMVFSVQLQWFPASDVRHLARRWFQRPIASPCFTCDHFILVATGVIARLTRTAMLEVLRLDFIRTARAKGVSERQVIFRHAFRMALVSVIPAIGIRWLCLRRGCLH
jgi:peptide/nickel transport system permease protein